MKNLLALTSLLLGSALFAESAQAQDIIDLDDEDSGRRGKNKKNGKAKNSRSAAESEVVREIEKGWYARAGVGGAFYLLNRSAIVKPGTSLYLAFGNDFVDNERTSMAYELNVYTGIHNGMPWYEQENLVSSGQISPAVTTQGDSRIFAASLAYEFSAYPARRFGVGVKIGAGVQYVPLLIHAEEWNTEILPELGGDSGAHNTIQVLAYGGPTFEYYTKLSHFSVGADVDVMYALNWDLGMSVSGYLKYTF